MNAVVNLGVLTPGNDAEAKARLAATEALAEQAVADVIYLGEAGYDVAGVYERLNAERDGLVALRVAISTMGDEDFSAWLAELAAADTRLRALLDEVVRLRQRAAERSQFSGFGWGLGSALAVAGVGYFVWRRRGRGRRR